MSSHPSAGPSHASPHEGFEPPSRRGFFRKALSILIGGLATLVPAGAGGWFIFGTLRRAGSGVPFIRVASLDALPADGKPRFFPVVVDVKQDAWNRYHDVAVGSVYLIRNPETPESITALNTRCPHVGCAVEARTEGFFCPCHESRFLASGERDEGCVAPRRLDSLETRIVDGAVEVQFQNFTTGIEEKVPA